MNIRKMGRNILKGLVVGAACALLLAFPASAAEEATIEEGIYVEGMSLGGLTMEEAHALVDSYVEERKTRTVTITVGGNPYSSEVAEDGLPVERMTVTMGELGLYCSNESVIDGADQIGKSGTLVERYKARKDLLHNTINYDLEWKWNEQSVLEYVNTHAPEFYIDPVDATVTMTDGVFYVTPSTVGREIITEPTTGQVLKSFADWDEDSNIVVSASVGEVAPYASYEALSTIHDKLGEATTYYSGDDTLGRNVNLILGTSLINGSVVMPGETFSANGAMEPYTAERGWQEGGSYTAEGTVEQTLGGGICQISSTFYNAALYAEVGIAQRNNHSMSVGYLPLGLDAAIAGDWKDLKITNTYATPIYIECYARGGALYFAIWGQETRPANRTISFESITTDTWEEEPTYQDDPTLPVGTEQVVSNGHTGYTSVVYKHVYVDGVEVESSILNEDYYRASGAVIRRGTGQ